MKRLVCFLSLLAIPQLPAQDDEPFPPEAFAPDRYESMRQRSPFIYPSFEENVQVTVDWTNDFRIVSVMRLGDESVVLAKKVSTDERIPIRTQENALGIRLVELKMSTDPHNVSALIEMGGQEGTIVYDESILSEVPRSVAPDNPALKAE